MIATLPSCQSPLKNVQVLDTLLMDANDMAAEKPRMSRLFMVSSCRSADLFQKCDVRPGSKDRCLVSACGVYRLFGGVMESSA